MKIAIVGCLHTTIPRLEELSDCDEVWTINNSHDAYGLPTDMIIAMDDLERDEDMTPKYVKAIVSAGVPVLSTGKKDKWPSVEPFPLQEVHDFLKQYYPEPCRLLDNSCNYALALALARGHTPIKLFAVDWCHPYKEGDLACGTLRWKFKGYGDSPDWFKYYDDFVLSRRMPGEPGIEAFHFLLGMAAVLGTEVEIAGPTAVLNMDRDRYFYGYQEQPDID